MAGKAHGSGTTDTKKRDATPGVFHMRRRLKTALLALAARAVSVVDAVR